MNRFGMRTLAYLTVACLLCVGVCGCKPMTDEPVVTTTTTTAETTATQATTTVVDEVIDQTTTTATNDTELTSTTVRPTAGDITTKGKTTTTVKAVVTTTTQKVVTTTQKATTTTKRIITQLTPLTPDQYYGYALLKKTGNPVMIETYDRLVAAVESMQSEIDFKAQPHPPTPDELDLVWTYYRLDYPHHFWLKRGKDGGYECTYGKTSGKVWTMKVFYAMSQDERRTKQAAVDKAANAILAKVSGSDSPYERERIIHDELCKLIVYDLKADRGHDLDGALLNGRAVCEGYAHSFQYLLYRAGVPCGAVLGQKTSGENHKWNFVVIDGKAYHVDVTWDDLKPQNHAVLGTVGWMYSYFNLTDEMIKREHRIFEEESYPLPVCNALTENYYQKNGTYITSRSIDQLATLLKQGNGIAHVYIADGDANGYYEWFKSNHRVFAERMGFQSYTYGNYSLGDGLILYMTSK